MFVVFVLSLFWTIFGTVVVADVSIHSCHMRVLFVLVTVWYHLLLLV